MYKRLSVVRACVALLLCALPLGCASDIRVDKPSQLCVHLPTGYVADTVDWERALIADLDAAFADLGYMWSTPTRSWELQEDWGHSWYPSRPSPGSGSSPLVSVAYFPDPPRHGQTCDIRVDVYSDKWIGHGEYEWRTFYRLRGALPALIPGAEVNVLDHPGLRTYAWHAPSLAERFAPGQPLPQVVRERVDSYERRSAVARWWKRTGVATSTALNRTGRAHFFGASMYFLFPPNWLAFLAFALAVWAGHKLVRPRVWRTVGFVALAVILLMPVKVPTFVGAIYVPHGFAQAFDFDPRYYAREPAFALAAALFTGALAWFLMNRLRRRGAPGASRGRRGKG